MITLFYAHSLENKEKSDWQLLKIHLADVANMASQFAYYFDAQEIAYYTGLLHDLGKYSLPYQERLHGGKKVNHSTAGAKIAVEKWGKPMGQMMAFCIAGHHAGLANGAKQGNNRGTLADRLSEQFGNQIPKLENTWQQEIHLPDRIKSPNQFKPSKKHPYFSYSFFTRMIYSCLVDADFLDTEKFYAIHQNKPIQRGNYPALSELHTQFNQYIQTFRQPEKFSELNQLRTQILDHAISQATQEKGLFSLTVPTGGGKTFTSMAFALEHAKVHELRRIIYVIPFTSIIEQNAREFKKAFGELGEQAVLEHHSNFDDSQLEDKGDSQDKLRRASENWDMPIVVTTAVQFFESLFADRSSRCRKLHNISGSVIILDEVQLLPLNLLRPIMMAIEELAQNYRCSVVFCTATQPAIQAKQGFYNGFENIRELAPNPDELFDKLRRTTVRHIGVQSDEQLLQKLAENEQLLIIVNNRRHARSLYDGAKDLDGIFHLTTLMCAKHRTLMLEKIRERLKQGSPCRVIATSLIEAGVDVDFPAVMRAEAGLDSVVQAAGRCNREGKRQPENSVVSVFATEEKWTMPPELKGLSAMMRSVVRSHGDDLLSPEALECYFSRVYEMKGDELDKKGILSEIHACQTDFPFQNTADKFRMIESHLYPVIIPFNQEAEDLIDNLRYAEHIGGILRRLQPYTVQIPENALAELFKAGRIEAINEPKFGKQFYALIGKDLYDPVAGLSWENATFLRAEGLVF